jgi:hypothetical protein
LFSKLARNFRQSEAIYLALGGVLLTGQFVLEGEISIYPGKCLIISSPSRLQNKLLK